MKLGISALALGLALAAVPAATAAPLQGAVFILLDTVRPDHLSLYGYERKTSPAIDALAERGVVFEQAVSSAPWTLPAAASIFTGRRVADSLDLSGAAARLTGSLVESIGKAGYKTAAFTEGVFVSSYYGFDRGFDRYEEEEATVRRNVAKDPFGAKRKPSTGSVEKTFAKAGEWLRKNRDERFFLLVHTYEPHTPYKRHDFVGGLAPGRVGKTFEIRSLIDLRRGALVFDADDRRYLEALYDGGIREADRQVGMLLQVLQDLSLTDRTLVVLTSDHGEEFGDHYPHYTADHGHSLRDDQLRVPLVLVDPSQTYPVRRVKSQVRALDSLPTVASLLGAELPENLDGRVLLPLMRGRAEPKRIAVGGSTKSGPKRGFVRTHRYKYIEITGEGSSRPFLHPPELQLYDLESDPGETHNLAEEKPDLVERFRQILAAEGRPEAEDPDFGEVSDEQRERLRALGYVE